VLKDIMGMAVDSCGYFLRSPETPRQQQQPCVVYPVAPRREGFFGVPAPRRRQQQQKWFLVEAGHTVHGGCCLLVGIIEIIQVVMIWQIFPVGMVNRKGAGAAGGGLAGADDAVGWASSRGAEGCQA
jgi:hypothetical protein